MFKKAVLMLLLVIVILSFLVILLFKPETGKNKIVTSDNKIAIVHVEGEISGGRGQSSLFGDYGGTDSIIKQLHLIRDDKEVKAVILRINSPGGSAPASQEVGEEVKKLRAAGKLVITSMGDMAASGGYWIAACSDKIYANPATMTGSIGVYIPYSNWEELYKKIGIQQEKIKSGPHKDILSSERPMTPEERELLQIMVDDLYSQFVAVVMEGRKMEEAQVRQLADGRIYTGRQAKNLGLVDELGNMYDAIEGAAKLAGIQGKPKIVEYGKTSPWAMLLGEGEEMSLEKILFKQLRDPQHVLMPTPLAMPVQETR